MSSLGVRSRDRVAHLGFTSFFKPKTHGYSSSDAGSRWVSGFHRCIVGNCFGLRAPDEAMP